MSATKKILITCFFVMLIFCVIYGFFFHNNLKEQCGVGMDCRCFANVVDNRLSRKQIRGFTKFLGEIKKYPNANILEFMDEEDAVALSKVLSVCRPKESNNREIENHGVVNKTK